MKLLKSLSIACITGVIMTCTPLFAEEKPKAEEPKKPKTKQMNPVVELKTNHGDISIELNEEKAPITVKNFLSYVDDKFYDNTVFHRVIKNFMIQGGGMEVKDGQLVEKGTKAPIKNESANGLKNNRGTIAMARTSDPDSATSQFFINVVDNKSLDHGGPYGGYAVFGRVTEGMEVVDVIRSVKTGNNGYHQDVPKTEVTILSISKK